MINQAQSEEDRSRTILLLQQNCARSPTVLNTILNDHEAAKASILCLQEPSVNPFTKLPSTHASYSLHLPACDNRDRARACIYTKKTAIPPECITLLPSPSPDIVIIRLDQNDGPPIAIVNVYVDPNQHTALPLLRRVLEHPLLDGCALLLLGDFNLHDPLWNPVNYLRQDPLAQDLIDTMLDYDLQLVSECGVPTFLRGETQTTIDLVLANEAAATALIECRTLPKLDFDMLSDHLGIVTQIQVSLAEPLTSRPSYRWTKMDHDLALSSIEGILRRWTPPDRTPDDVDRAATELHEAIIDAFSASVPESRPSIHEKRWWSPELHPLKQEAARLRRRWQTIRTDENHLAYSEAAKTYQTAMNKQKRLYWQRYISTVAPNDLYKAVRVTKSGRQADVNIPPLVTDDGIVATPHDIAAHLHHVFAEPTAPYNADDIQSIDYPDPAPDSTFTIEALDRAIERLPPDKAPGLDGIKGRFLKAVWPALRQPLFTLLATSFDITHYPTPWKHFLTCILRKPGKPAYNVAKAYRPIALLYTVAKLYDIVLADLLSTFLEETSALPNNIFGGRQARSTTDALCTLVEDVHTAWANKEVVGLLSLDAEAAFPSLRFDRLESEMKRLAIPANLIRTVLSYLIGRSTDYWLNGVMSPTMALYLGLPQGSSLSGILANIYFASFPRDVPVEPVKALGFADDQDLYVKAPTVAIARETLGNLEPRIADWSQQFGVRLSPTKSIFTYFTRNVKKVDDTPLSFFGRDLAPETTVKALGVTFDRALMFKEHAQQAAARGKKAVLALSSLGSTRIGIGQKLFRQVYVTTVCPKMDYAAIVWHHFGKTSAATHAFELVQNIAARKILGAFRTTSTYALAYDANLTPAATRLDKAVALAAARIAYLPEANPVRERLRSCQTYQRRTFASRLDTLARSVVVNLPRCDDLQPIPLALKPLSWVSPLVVHLPPDADEAIKDHDTVILRARETTIAFTDGSKFDGGVGAAVYVYDPAEDPGANESVVHLHLGSDAHYHVFTAELMAILIALTLPVSTHDLHVFSDSRSALQALAGRPKRSADLAIILAIHELAQRRRGLTIHLHWIKAHADIYGNERADEHAKLAACVPECSDERCRAPPLPLSAVRTAIVAAIRPPPENLSKGGAHRAIRGGVPSAKVFDALTKLPRSLCSTMVQLRSSHVALLDYLKWTGHRASNRCLKCKSPETVHHYIMACRRYTSLRSKLARKLAENGIAFTLSNALSDPKAIPFTAEFVAQSRRFPLAKVPVWDEILPTRSDD